MCGIAGFLEVLATAEASKFCREDMSGFALDWLLLLIVPSWVVLHFTVVRREESYLERKFGEAYRLYKDRVPRYLFVH